MAKVPWSEIQMGDLVKGRDEYTWEVSRRVGDNFTLERDGKEPFRITPDPLALVELVATAKQAMEMAQALVQVRLGGEVVAKKDTVQGAYRTPVTFATPGGLLAHLYLLHGVVGDGEATLSALRAQHDRLHIVSMPPVEHKHDPEFYSAGEVDPMT